MIVLNPRSVRFGSRDLGGVVLLALDRWSGELAEEYADAGPFAVFVDSPERKVQAKVVQEVSGTAASGADDGPGLGEEEELSFVRSPNASDVGAERVSVRCVVTRVGYDIGRGGSARRVIEMRAVSSDGMADPVVVAPA